jgi:DNA adenine methylase
VRVGYFSKKQPSATEIYNDLNSNLVLLFKTIRDNYPLFKHKATWTLHSREQYYDVVKFLQSDESTPDIDKAIAYATKQVQSFAGSGGWAYEIKPRRVANTSWAAFLRRLDAINCRLSTVMIEHLNYTDIIPKFDRSETLFYIDPPYYNTESYYNNHEVNFTRDDHANLADLLLNIKGRFCLSYFDHPDIRELYSGCRIIEHERPILARGIRHGAPSKTRPRATELLIMNY